MGYRWLDDGDTVELSSGDLRPDDVPPAPTAGDDHDHLDTVFAFAHTFDGYRWADGLRELTARAEATRSAWEDDGRLPGDLDLLRGCLFHWARARRHTGSTDLDRDTLAWIGALLAGIRARAHA